MENASFMRVDEVAKELGISKSYAYKIVQKLNAELAEKGYMVISGRVNKRKSEALRQSVKPSLGSENSLISSAVTWI